MTSRKPALGQGHTFEAVAARELERLLRLAPMLLGWLLALALAAVLHAWWAGWWWAVAAASGVLVVMAASLAALRHHLHGQALILGTWACLAIWLPWATRDGLRQPVMGAWVIGGLTLAGCWAMFVHMQAHTAHAGGLAGLLEEAAPHAGLLTLGVHGVHATGRKATGMLRHHPGDTHEEIAAAIPAIESAARLPAGSLQVTPGDGGHESRFTLSDPNVLRDPMPWPGPSRPGRSIADPIRMGVWQDGEPVDYRILNHHLQVNGMTGSGKTTGFGWTEVAETITRPDAAVLLADISKGEQTVAPLRGALHAAVTDEDDVPGFFAAIHALVRARTDHLGRAGLHAWEPGCGLTHLTCWLEEAPDLLALLTQQQGIAWVADVRNARSAGMRWVISLQRSDFSQMRTIARGQLASACFGVKNRKDAAFGLSDAQRTAGAKPELWTDTRPGMFYLEAPSITASRRAMPARTWHWGSTADRIRRHCSEYPASARPLDPVTAAILTHQPPGPRGGGQPAEPGHGGLRLAWDAAAEPIEVDLPPIPVGHQTKNRQGMNPIDARRELARQLDQWRTEGKTRLTRADFEPLLTRVGRTRPWLYIVLPGMPGVNKTRGGWQLGGGSGGVSA